MVRQPLLGVYGEDAFGQAEAVDARTALRSFTLWAAHQMFLDDQTGSIEVGKYADLAVWDVDPYSAEPDAIKEMQCQMTLLEGEVVYRKEPCRKAYFSAGKICFQSSFMLMTTQPLFCASSIRDGVKAPTWVSGRSLAGP